jgi:hypothetical protein
MVRQQQPLPHARHALPTYMPIDNDDTGQCRTTGRWMFELELGRRRLAVRDELSRICRRVAHARVLKFPAWAARPAAWHVRGSERIRNSLEPCAFHGFRYAVSTSLG